MQRLEHISTIIADLGDIFTFIAPITAVPIIVAILYSEWNMILPMAVCPCHVLYPWYSFPKTSPFQSGSKAFYCDVFSGTFLAYLCNGEWYPVHARVAYGIH